MKSILSLAVLPLLAASALAAAAPAPAGDVLAINAQEYLEMRGLNVMLAHDYYPESHQGGVGIIQNGLRVATNGDLRLQPTPGQWQPTPVVGKRQVDRTAQEISVRMTYPDGKKDRQGFNPISYPDLQLGYVVKIKPAGKAFRIIVDLDRPLPAEWVGKVGFNLELFPGFLFGKAFRLGDRFGTFPRQANGPGAVVDGDYEIEPLGVGPKLTVAPESERQRMTIEAVKGGELRLLDGRAQHNNGWFVVRSLVPAGAAADAIEWLVTPHAMPDWKSEPVIQISQVGYHPAEAKIAVIELDRHETERKPVRLYRTKPDGGLTEVTGLATKDWGYFLRYHYLQFDFSKVVQPGLYVIGYGDQRSPAFQISERVFERNVWQPTVEYFLPVQMCHMRVNDRYRVWHGLCHDDDALMAPVNHNHFDGYAQGPSTLTAFHPGDHVPGLDHGGWHDAGDYDLRIESQADTVHGLSLAWELFHPTLDNTTVDQTARIVEIHRPDGKPDVLQQIEHGVLSIVGGYHALGRLYRGLQDASLHQYTHLGDAAIVQHHAADQLDVERPHAKHPAGRFAHRGEGRDQQIVERSAVGEILAEFFRAARKLGIGKRPHLVFHRVDGFDPGPGRLDAAVVGGTENLTGETAETDHPMVLSIAILVVCDRHRAGPSNPRECRQTQKAPGKRFWTPSRWTDKRGLKRCQRRVSPGGNAKFRHNLADLEAILLKHPHWS